MKEPNKYVYNPAWPEATEHNKVSNNCSDGTSCYGRTASTLTQQQTNQLFKTAKSKQEKANV